jgi:hypothetical protein
MSILDRTENLIDIYVYAQGVSKIPRQYHLWSFISLIAACLQDRVWIEEVAGQPLFPNLYIVLWGDSGSGKSIAIRSTFNLAMTDLDLAAFVNAKHGRGTFQAIADMLGKTGRKNEMGLPEYEQPKIWWTMDELANDVGDGPRASAFIKGVTEIYYCPPQWTDVSRTYGLVTLTKPVFNWLAGSTAEWYASTVKQDGIDGGFQPRTITVPGTVNYSPGEGRQWPPVYPKDRDVIMKIVLERLRGLCQLPILPQSTFSKEFHSRSGTGEFVLHEEVSAKLEEWQCNRAPPEEGLEAYWNQDGVKLRKLMMILSVAERSDLLITPQHYRRAWKMLKWVSQNIPRLIKFNTKSKASYAIDLVSRTLQRRGLMMHSDLLTYVASKGVSLEDLRNVRKTLFEMGRIDFYIRTSKESDGDLEYLEPDRVDKVKRGLWYKWKSAKECMTHGI